MTCSSTRLIVLPPFSLGKCPIAPASPLLPSSTLFLGNGATPRATQTTTRTFLTLKISYDVLLLTCVCQRFPFAIFFTPPYQLSKSCLLSFLTL
jgi:hypothetical protein